MKILIRNIRFIINNIYLFYIKSIYVIRKKIFNIEFANKLFLKIDRNAVIPLIKFCGGKVGEGCTIESPIYFHLAFNDLSNFEIGNNSRISKNCFLDLSNKIIIGNNCTLGMEVMVCTHTHYGECNFNNLYSNFEAKVTIKDNTYIGARSTLLNGCVIEGNCIIAAGSLINKSIAANNLVAGVPAKIIKKL